jgi:PAS domain S-box-containing protein
MMPVVESAPAPPQGRLPRSLSAVETWGFGLTGLLLWTGVAPGIHAELGPQAIAVWLVGTLIGMLLNLQIKQLGSHYPDISGGTPNYLTRLLQDYPLLARYGAIGYYLSWVAVLPINAIILTHLIQANLEPLGISCPEIPLRIGFTTIAFVVAFSGTRAISILHLAFLIPAVGFLLAFCLQGFGWLVFSPESPGLWPSEVPEFHLDGWAKWFLNATYAVYACETASSFVADSQRPQKTLHSLWVATLLMPVVYLGGSWVVMRLATSPGLTDNTFLNLLAAARPFWGNSAAFLVTFLLVSSSLLACATAVSNCPRILYQLALDGHLSPVFAVTSRQGVLGPGLLLTLGLSLVCLLWENLPRILMITSVGWLVCFILLHGALWLRRGQPEVRWPRWSLGFCLLEIAVLGVVGMTWSGQGLALGLLLPVTVLAIDQGIRRMPFGPFQATWWYDHPPRSRSQQPADFLAFQVIVLLSLLCGAVAAGWLVATGISPVEGVSTNLLVVLLFSVGFVGVAIACWTTLPQITAMAEAKEQTEQLFQIALDAIVVVDKTGQIRQVNPAAEYLLQAPAQRLIGQCLSQMLPQLPSQPTAWPNRSEQTLTSANGYTRSLEVAVSAQDYQDFQEYVIILHDVTDRIQAEAKLQALVQQQANLAAQATQQAQQLETALHKLQRTQTQLIQTEKMSSLGQLVAGVAHEINNPVNFIHANVSYATDYATDLLTLLSLYKTSYPQPLLDIDDAAAAIDIDFLIEDFPKLLASMKVGADRIRDIVLSLRNFSRLDESEVKAVNIHDGIDSTLMILNSRLKATAGHAEIQVIRQYGDLAQVECYAGQLNQVFMNLLSNAIDALEEVMQTQKSYQPSITIRTETVDRDWVAIHIVDNGPGISTPIQERLFDPFFTTKEVGKGTGMGLSISYQIITDRHRGALICLSEVGQGTEFVIKIPQRQSNSHADRHAAKVSHSTPVT